MSCLRDLSARSGVDVEIGSWANPDCRVKNWVCRVVHWVQASCDLMHVLLPGIHRVLGRQLCSSRWAVFDLEWYDQVHCWKQKVFLYDLIDYFVLVSWYAISISSVAKKRMGSCLSLGLLKVTSKSFSGLLIRGLDLHLEFCKAALRLSLVKGHPCPREQNWPWLLTGCFAFCISLSIRVTLANWWPLWDCVCGRR